MLVLTVLWFSVLTNLGTPDCVHKHDYQSNTCCHAEFITTKTTAQMLSNSFVKLVLLECVV